MGYVRRGLLLLGLLAFVTVALAGCPDSHVRIKVTQNAAEVKQFFDVEPISVTVSVDKAWSGEIKEISVEILGGDETGKGAGGSSVVYSDFKRNGRDLEIFSTTLAPGRYTVFVTVSGKKNGCREGREIHVVSAESVIERVDEGFSRIVRGLKKLEDWTWERWKETGKECYRGVFFKAYSTKDYVETVYESIRKRDMSLWIKLGMYRTLLKYLNERLVIMLGILDNCR